MNMELWLNTFCFCRITSFCFSYRFSGRSVPTMAKITFGLGLSITVADKIDLPPMTTNGEVVAYAATQLVIGLSLAKIIEMLLNVPKMAGHIIDFDIGFSQSSLFDVNSGTQSTLIATIFDMFSLLYLCLLVELIISLQQF